MSTELTASESKQLQDFEKVIEIGVSTFVEVGTALAVINEQRLYRSEYTSFAEYVSERWGMVKGQAYRLITAAQVATNVKKVSPIGDTSIRESHARELAKLPPEEQAEVWEEVAETTATPTAKVVKAVVEKRQEAKSEPVAKRMTADQKAAQEAINNAEPGRELLALVRTCMSRLKKLPEVPGLELVNGRRQSIQSHLENAANAISVYLPAEICPRCHGKKCADCGNFGWVNRIMQQQLKK
jgi:hypothetical protein